MRIYFNDRTAPDKPWSVDQGTSDTEESFGGLFLNGMFMAFFDPQAKPCAWLEPFGNVKTTRYKNELHIERASEGI